MATQSHERLARLDQSGALLWLTWVGANAVGGLVGETLVGLLGGWVVRILSAGFSLGCLSWLLAFVLIGGAGLLIWLPVGLTQALVLHRMIPGFNREVIRRWTLTSALAGSGAAILNGLVLAIYISVMFALEYTSLYSSSGVVTLLYLVSTGAVGGVVFGLSQWVLLERYVVAPGGWVVVSVFAWSLAIPLGGILLDRGLPTTAAIVGAMSGTMPSLSIGSVLLGTLVITLAAAVTGLALPRLMRSPVRRPPRPDLPRVFAD